MFTKITNAVADWRLGIRANGIVATNKQGAVHYASSSHHHIREVLDRLQLSESDTFLDIGCGKGRVLAIAKTYSVGLVVGIEYEPALVASAKRNLAGSNIELWQGAAEYFDYSAITAAYAFIPVEPEILDLILGKIHSDRARLTIRKPFRIAYVMETPERQAVFARHHWLKQYACFINSNNQIVRFYFADESRGAKKARLEAGHDVARLTSHRLHRCHPSRGPLFEP
jgi:SAM-dependent methyltransferase